VLEQSGRHGEKLHQERKPFKWNFTSVWKSLEEFNCIVSMNEWKTKGIGELSFPKGIIICILLAVRSRFELLSQKFSTFNGDLIENEKINANVKKGKNGRLGLNTIFSLQA
jgi:hypothetical protein